MTSRFQPDPFDVERALASANRVHSKYKPVFDALASRDRAAVAWYFLPHPPREKPPPPRKKSVLPTRPRVCGWYCPFADQRFFPSGHRYCVNVYTGCSHGCEYCYAAAYQTRQAKCKDDFPKKIARDFIELESYDVSPAPVHLSNSTDPFQLLELQFGHTRLALQYIRRYRNRFTSVVMLTKNPQLAAKSPYCELLQELAVTPSGHARQNQMRSRGAPGARVEVSLAFWQDAIRAAMEPGAPRVADRVEAIRQLRKLGIPVVLRIDPLFPRSPVAGKSLRDYGLPEFQPLDDLNRLVGFAADVGVLHVVYSPAKIVIPKDAQGNHVGRKQLPVTTQNLVRVYEDLAAPVSAWRKRSWRLPPSFADEQVVAPFLELCRRHGVSAVYCKENLLATP